MTVRAVDPRLGRDAIGARVTVEIGDRRLTRLVAPASGYQASHSPAVHFGVGAAEAVDRFEVRWADGAGELFAGGATNRSVELRRGSGEPVDG